MELDLLRNVTVVDDAIRTSRHT